MESVVTESRLFPLFIKPDCDLNALGNTFDKLNSNHSNIKENVMTGIKLSPSPIFKRKTSKYFLARLKDRQNNLNTPDINSSKENYQKFDAIMLDFRRILQSNSSVEIIPNVSNRHLLHAVVALFDNALTEMQPDVLYDTICGKWARTIIILQKEKDCLDFQRHQNKNKQNESIIEELNCSQNEHLKSEVESERISNSVDVNSEDEDERVYKPEESAPSAFSCVFSDTDSETSDNEEEDDEDFSKGFMKFINAVKKRKECLNNNQMDVNEIGIEKRIVAALTFEKSFCHSTEKVLHLTLMAVRKRFQKCGIGKYLLSQIKNPDVVGLFDAIVVHADNTAMKFFSKHGFTDDSILNHKWIDLAEQFTNCTLMCYLPPFTTQQSANQRHSVTETDLVSMSKQVRQWREKATAAYQAEISCVTRMTHEIQHLRHLVETQQHLINKLSDENSALERDKLCLEQKLLSCEFKTVKKCLELSKDEEEINEESTADLLQELEEASKLRQLTARDSDEQSDSATYIIEKKGEDSNKLEKSTHDSEKSSAIEKFLNGLSADSSLSTKYQVDDIIFAELGEKICVDIDKAFDKLYDPFMIIPLYYCGPLNDKIQLNEIMCQGFSKKNFTAGCYGNAIYFSKHPSKAMQFSKDDKLLVALVGLGNTKTVVKQDPSRNSVEEMFDSVITPGRLSTQSDSGDGLLCQEYLIFNALYAKPLYIIHYSVKC